MVEVNEAAKQKWEQVHVAVGTSVYDPKEDHQVIDVVRRADKLMYDNKHMRKKSGQF